MIAMIMSDERVIAFAIWIITALLAVISVMGAFGIKIYIAIQKRRSAKVAELFDEIREFGDELRDVASKLDKFSIEVLSVKGNVDKITEDMHNVKSDIRLIKSTLKI